MKSAIGIPFATQMDHDLLGSRPALYLSLQTQVCTKMENLVLYRKTIAFLATDGFEQIELTEPWNAIKNAGGTLKLISPKIQGTIRGMHHDVPGDEFIVDFASSDAIVEEYDGLVLPGGVFSPDALRLDEASVKFVRAQSCSRLI